jgi:hypothetical protein
MKRHNPETKKPWKRGEVRQDGYMFWAYRTSTKNKDGFFRMCFLRPEKFVSANAKNTKKQSVSQTEIKKLINAGVVTKSVRSDGKFWKFGEKKDGKFFINYANNALDNNGHQYPIFLDADSWLRAMIHRACNRARTRAKKQNIPFSISVDYLLSVYPKDGLCPVFKIKMEWAGDRINSPSLDRLSPEIGYIEGNVNWISWKANMIKSVGTASEHRTVADWIEKSRRCR